MLFFRCQCHPHLHFHLHPDQTHLRGRESLTLSILALILSASELTPEDPKLLPKAPQGCQTFCKDCFLFSQWSLTYNKAFKRPKSWNSWETLKDGWLQVPGDRERQWFDACWMSKRVWEGGCGECFSLYKPSSREESNQPRTPRILHTSATRTPTQISFFKYLTKNISQQIFFQQISFFKYLTHKYLSTNIFPTNIYLQISFQQMSL